MCWQVCDSLWDNCTGSAEECAVLYETCNMVCDVIGAVETIVFY